MKLKVTGVPVGSYTAEFVGAEPRAADEKNNYGPGILWKFVIHGGAQDGQEIGRITGDRPTAKNAAGKFLKAIAGNLPGPGTEVDIDAHIGRMFSIIVAETQSGGTRVETAIPAQA